MLSSCVTVLTFFFTKLQLLLFNVYISNDLIPRGGYCVFSANDSGGTNDHLLGSVAAFVGYLVAHGCRASAGLSIPQTIISIIDSFFFFRCLCCNLSSHIRSFSHYQRRPSIVIVTATDAGCDTRERTIQSLPNVDYSPHLAHWKH